MVEERVRSTKGLAADHPPQVGLHVLVAEMETEQETEVEQVGRLAIRPS
jgi:hypothetical protein